MRTGTLFAEQRRVDHAGVDPDRLLALLETRDLRGHGGGAFPTAAKLRAARGRRPDLIVNACDGEPLVTKDEALLERSPHLVADGIALVARLLGARRVHLAVHRGSRAEVLAGRVLGDRVVPARAEALVVPARYVASEASALTALARGGEARPFDHELPLTAGSRRHRPTVVLNAETVARVAALALDPDRPATRLVSVAAARHPHPVVLELPLDASLRSALTAAGLAEPEAYLVGGYAGRWLPAAAGGVTLAGLGHDLGAGLVLGLGSECPLGFVGSVLDWLAGESAGQCGPCVFGLPALAADWHALGDPAHGVEAEQRLRRRLPLLAGRGACHHPDGAAVMAASALELFAGHAEAHRSGWCDAHDVRGAA